MNFEQELCCLRKQLRTLSGNLDLLTSTVATLMESLAAGNSIIYVTADYTATADDATIVGNTSADPIEITLPDASTVEGQRYTFIRVPSLGEDLTITPAGSDTINGDANFVLVNDWSSCTLRAAVDGWLITATYNT